MNRTHRILLTMLSTASLLLYGCIDMSGEKRKTMLCICCCRKRWIKSKDLPNILGRSFHSVIQESQF